MKYKSFLFGLFVIICETRLDFYSDDCLKYKEKFDDKLLLNFSVETFDMPSQNHLMILKYYDSYYYDDKFWGLTQEDGKSIDETCIDLQILMDNKTIEFTDLKAYSDPYTNERYLSFQINQTVFEEANQPKNYVFFGSPAPIDGLIYIYYNAAGTDVNLFNKSINLYSNYGKVNFCSDITCSNTTIPNLFLNDLFIVQFIVHNSQLKKYYLVDTSVYFVGYGLNKKAQIQSIDNSTPRKVLLLLQAEVIWPNVQIYVTSNLSTTASGTGYLKKTLDPVSGTSEIIQCIKMNTNSTSCPTCDEQCQVNGFAEDGCPACEDYSVLISAFLLLYLII